MAPYFRMKPLTTDGRSVDGGDVIIPIKFMMNGTPAPQLDPDP